MCGKRIARQRDEIRSELAALKARQFGVFERTQARALGLSDHALQRDVAAGRAERLYPRVFRDPAIPYSWEQDLFGALLWAGERSCVSHRAAAALWRLDGFEPGFIEITSPSSLRPPKGVIVHRAQLRSSEMTHVSGMQVTTPTRTILDISSVVDEETVEIALDCALRRGLTSFDYLRRKHAERAVPGRRGSRTIGHILRQRDPGNRPLESALETRFLRLLRQERVPLPQAGYEVGPYRLDFAYPKLHLGIELDGYAFHSARTLWARDLARQNYLVRLGWTILRFTWDDITRRGSAVADEVRHHVAPTLLR